MDIKQIVDLIVYNQIGPDGKTIRESNLELMHTIPLGTLVEVDCEYSDEHGIRAFVVQHQRDCDGTPLYGLHSKADVMEYMEDMQDLYNTAYFSGVKYGIVNHISEDSLIIIRPPKEESITG